jgi:hypothetical protein
VTPWHGREGLLKRIHVDQHAIRRNRKLGTEEPPISVKTYRQNIKCLSVEIGGPSRVVYSPEHPLSCGARLWIETRAEVTAQ